MRLLVVAAIAVTLLFPRDSLAKPTADQILSSGKLKEGTSELQQYLAQHPDDDEAKFSLGLVQFVTAVEHLGQSLYRYGLRHQEGGGIFELPILRFPIPQNQFPEKLTYESWRRVFVTLIEDLTIADQTLAKVRDEKVKNLVHVGQIQLKFDDTRVGQITVFEVLKGLRLTNPAIDDDFSVAFDRADVSWLRGYSNLLMGFAEVFLAHDSRQTFDATAHLFFRKPETPFPFSTGGRNVFRFTDYDIADLIAFVHLLHFPVVEKERLTTALNHFQTVLAMSREMWKFAQSETDDDQEWIPNAKQQGVLRIRVTQQMIDTWLAFVDEAELLLQGKRLVPFWRGDGKQGVNLRRVFLEPQTLDAVLWIQGTGAAPFLEDGEVTRTTVWTAMNQVFRGQMFGFAAWFN